MPPVDREAGTIDVIYDGECPFCRSYVLLYRLREAGRTVRLIDARSDDPAVGALRSRGFDLDRGMAVRADGRLYYGAEAMNYLALIGSGATFFNRLNRLLFRRPRLARLIYPLLLRGRLLTLRALGRPLIGDHPGEPANG